MMCHQTVWPWCHGRRLRPRTTFCLAASRLQFAATVSGWQPLSVVDSVLRARQTWRVHEEDTPRLRLAVHLVMAARQTALFDILDTVSESLHEDQSVFNAFHQLVAFLINSVVRPN